MVKIALIGAGKMGISHLSILGAHPEVDLIGVSDSSRMPIDAIQKYSPFPCYTDYKKMLKVLKPDAVFVAVPTKLHGSIIKDLLEQDINVFAEKPFCLNPNEGLSLVKLAKEKKLINQVGYHNRFIGTFNEIKRLVDGGHLGILNHFSGEAYGPVVIKKKNDTWRSNPQEGGGCLMDYASHVIDLINYILAPVKSVSGSMLKSIFSTSVEDAVYALLILENNISGTLSVNWSDETYRKMSTSVTLIGSKGKLISDANELKIYFNSKDCPAGYTKGWNIKNITDFTEPVDFNLRGEEYTSQIDYFVNALQGKVPNNKNTFEDAWYTDRAIDLIKKASN